ISPPTSAIFSSRPSAALGLRTPSVSATISVETLSVSRVKRGSPFFTCSPDFLCQTETTPLENDSPTAGIFTCTLIARLHKRKPPRESNAKSFHPTIQVPVVAGCRRRNTASSCAGLQPTRLALQDSNASP